MTTQDEITKLTDLYQRLICLDHHKDRDCHWELIEKWSYGEPPKYVVTHNGYVYKRIEETHESHGEALDSLLKHVKEAIDSDLGWAESVVEFPDDWDHVDFALAQRKLEIAKKFGYET